MTFQNRAVRWFSFFLLIFALFATWTWFKTGGQKEHQQQEERASLSSNSNEPMAQALEDDVTRETLGYLEVQIGMRMAEMMSSKSHIMTSEMIQKMAPQQRGQHAHHGSPKSVTSKSSSKNQSDPVTRYFIRTPSDTIEIDLPNTLSSSGLNSGALVALVKEGTPTGKREHLARIKSSRSLDLKSRSQSAVYNLVVVSHHSAPSLGKNKSSNVSNENKGPQRTLVIPVAHPDAPTINTEIIQNRFFGTGALSLNSIVKRWSRNQAHLVGQIAPAVKGPRCIGEETSGTIEIAIEQLDKSGAIDLTQVDRVILLFPKYENVNCGSFIWGTIAKPFYHLKNGRVGRFSVSWLYDSDFDYSFHLGATHEFLHNLGLHHASSRYCVGGHFHAECSNSEYGDYTQYLGHGGVQEPYINSAHLEQAGWADGKVPTVTAGDFNLSSILDIDESIPNLGIKINLKSWPNIPTSIYGAAHIYLDYYNHPDQWLRGVYIRYHNGTQQTFVPTFVETGGALTFDRRLNQAGDVFTDVINGVQIVLLSMDENQARVRVSQIATPVVNSPEVETFRLGSSVYQGGSCREIFVDVKNANGNFSNEYYTTISSVSDQYLDVRNCDLFQNLGTDRVRLRCFGRHDPILSHSVEIQRVGDPGAQIKKFKISPWDCGEQHPRNVYVKGLPNTNALEPSCNNVTAQAVGQIPSNEFVSFSFYDYQNVNTATSCGVYASSNFASCPGYVSHQQRTFVVANFESSNVTYYTSFGTWSCLNQTARQLEIPFDSLNSDRIFRSGFEDSAAAGNFCSQVTARLRVNSAYSGKTVTVRASEILYPQRNATCEIQVPLFSSGTRDLSCTFSALNNLNEHYLLAKVDDTYFAHGAYGRWTCD